ncbi:MAG: hypothetical protein GDA54_01870 [Alphaproteobacteria bacterium GM7ARS4]|nr:hypothetical protein [Alphaproteobacteria bacterium GM7ARS4]
MKTLRMATGFVVAVCFAYGSTPAVAGDMEDHGMMHMMDKGGSMAPMVELPSDMSKSDVPSDMIMMMDTPDGEKAFIPWYLTKSYREMSRSMEKSGMPDGTMMQMEDGSFAFVPWYLTPQHSDMLMHDDKMGRGMKKMSSGDMRYVFVPWYKR